MLAQLIQRRGIGARAKEADALSMSKIFALETKGVALVCLCYLENATPPEAFILVSLLNETDKLEDAEAAQPPPGTDLVKGSLRDTLQRIMDLANSKTAERLSEISPSGIA